MDLRLEITEKKQTSFTGETVFTAGKATVVRIRCSRLCIPRAPFTGGFGSHNESLRKWGEIFSHRQSRFSLGLKLGRPGWRSHSREHFLPLQPHSTHWQASMSVPEPFGWDNVVGSFNLFQSYADNNHLFGYAEKARGASFGLSKRFWDAEHVIFHPDSIVC